MPKTASKRAEARKVARVQRAHEALPPRPGSAAIKRRVPLAAARAEPRGVTTLIRDYPWATTIFVLLLVGLVFLVMYNQRLGPWTAKAAPTQATCNLKTHTCNKAPLMTINTSHYYSATLKTKYGNIVIQLDAQNAPIAVNNFVFLARQHFYDGLTFNRVEHIGQISPLTNQPSNLDLIQGGAGGGKGGGPGYTLKFESNTSSYVPGTVAVSDESQFFITLSDMTHALTGSAGASNFDIFGHVTAGLDVAKKIALNDTIQSVTIGESTVVPTPAPTLTPTSTSTNTPAPTATPKK
jgi:cyclophilin family peptidyl-prolyl cis-trans isomerase